MRTPSFISKSGLAHVLLGLVPWPGGGNALAQAPLTPQQVVQANARAWSEGDLAGLLTLVADDARSYDRSADPNKLAGEMSEVIGTKKQLEIYFEEAISRGPTAREQVGAMATVGDLVIAAGESAQPPDFATRMQFLTGYRIRDSQIRDLWHIAWRAADAPVTLDPAQAVRQLIDAHNARDARRIRALLDPEAQHFRHSRDPRALAEEPVRPRTASHPYFASAPFAAAPGRIEAIELFSVGDLVVEQSHVTGLPNGPYAAVNTVSVYRIRDGRIVNTWLLGEETLPANDAGAATAAGDVEAVVLKDFEALSAGDVEGLAAVFAPQFTMYRLPVDPHALAGPPSTRMRTREELRRHFREAFVAEPPAPHQVLQIVSLDDLVVVRVAVHGADGTPPDHAFTAFRVRDQLIEAIWHIGHERDADRRSGSDAVAVIERLVAAHNRGDADAFVDLYHPQARHAHVKNDPGQLGGGPAKRTTDAESRRRFYRELYGEGPPTQVEIVASVALGEWVATRERYAEPGKAPRDHLTIYRVRDGLIVDDWHLAP